MKKIYFWAADICENSGEGILANNFLNNLRKDGELININSLSRFQKNNLNFKNIIFQKFYHAYIYPIIGAIKLRFYQKKGLICYVNYLPLWNSILFLILPKKTILGPISGYYKFSRYNVIFNFFENLSLKILKSKNFSNLIFSTDYIKSKNFDKSYKYNFILNNFYFLEEKKIDKQFDIVIYNRIHKSKGNKFIHQIVKLLCENNFRCAIFGDNIEVNGAKNYGWLNRKDTQDIISKSKYALSSKENIYSFFIQDCLSRKLKIFFNKEFSSSVQPRFKNFMIKIDYNKIKSTFEIIKKEIS